MIKINLIFLLSVFSFLFTLSGCGPSKYAGSTSPSNSKLVPPPSGDSGNNGDISNLGNITSATGCLNVTPNNDPQNIGYDWKSFLINYNNNKFGILLFMKSSSTSCDINQLYEVRVLGDTSSEKFSHWMNDSAGKVSPSNVESNDQKNLSIINKSFTQAIKDILEKKYANLPLNQIIQNNVSDVYGYIDSQFDSQLILDQNSGIGLFRYQYQQTADDSVPVLYHIGMLMVGDVDSSKNDISNGVINNLSIVLRQLK